MAINGIASFSSFHVCSNNGTDTEWERILRRLKEYGVKTTGSKANDLAKLRDIEMQEMKTLTAPTCKFLTISQSEQEKFFAHKKEIKQNMQIKQEKNNKNISTEKHEKTEKAINALGEQIYLAIKMKNKKIL